MLKTVEGRGAARRSRPLDAVSHQIDSSEYTPPNLAVHRLSRRLGVSAALATVIADLAALGPREARHG